MFLNTEILTYCLVKMFCEIQRALPKHYRLDWDENKANSPIRFKIKGRKPNDANEIVLKWKAAFLKVVNQIEKTDEENVLLIKEGNSNLKVTLWSSNATVMIQGPTCGEWTLSNIAAIIKEMEETLISNQIDNFKSGMHETPSTGNTKISVADEIPQVAESGEAHNTKVTEPTEMKDTGKNSTRSLGNKIKPKKRKVRNSQTQMKADKETTQTLLNDTSNSASQPTPNMQVSCPKLMHGSAPPASTLSLSQPSEMFKNFVRSFNVQLPPLLLDHAGFTTILNASLLISAGSLT